MDLINTTYSTLEIEDQFGFLEESMQMDDFEEQQYFYHTDHLGSSAWISDIGGDAYQHLQYMPYGETFVSQRKNDWETPFKFTGHERDMMTGFDYAHARYYSSEFSLFLSVDPLSDMYPSTSPFMYVRGNPIILIDPTGMNDDEYKLTQEGKIEFVAESEGSDVLYATNADGSINRDKSLTLNEGTLSQRSEKVPLLKSLDLSGVIIENNEDDARKLFTFCSDNFQEENGKKEMEFGFLTGEKGGNTTSIVYTNGKEGELNANSVIKLMGSKEGMELKYHYHNHPGNARYNILPSGFNNDGSPIPNSLRDRGAAEQVLVNFRLTLDFYVYHPASGMITMYDDKEVTMSINKTLLWR